MSLVRAYCTMNEPMQRFQWLWTNNVTTGEGRLRVFNTSLCMDTYFDRTFSLRALTVMRCNDSRKSEQLFMPMPVSGGLITHRGRNRCVDDGGVSFPPWLCSCDKFNVHQRYMMWLPSLDCVDESLVLSTDTNCTSLTGATGPFSSESELLLLNPATSCPNLNAGQLLCLPRGVEAPMPATFSLKPILKDNLCLQSEGAGKVIRKALCTSNPQNQGFKWLWGDSGRTWGRLQQAGTDLCVQVSDADTPTLRSLIITSPCSNSSLQQWIFIGQAMGVFRYRGDPRLCMDDGGMDGFYTWLWSCEACIVNQRFETREISVCPAQQLIVADVTTCAALVEQKKFRSEDELRRLNPEASCPEVIAGQRLCLPLGVQGSPMEPPTSTPPSPVPNPPSRPLPRDSFNVHLVQEDALVLLELARAWNVSAFPKGWNMDNTCHSWERIKCSEGGKVFFLDLGSFSDARDGIGSNLILPESVTKLNALEHLNLSSNSFRGAIPPSYSTLTLLTVLDFSRNDIDNGVPNVLGLRALVALDLSYNRLSGEIPSTLGQLSNLTSLVLHGNSFEGPLPEALSSLTALQVLDVSKNLISGDLPPMFRNFLWPHLQTLDLSANLLTNGFPPVESFTSLQKLVLSRNDLNGSVPDSISALVSLTSLDLKACSFTGSILLKITSLSNLRALDIRENRFREMIPPSLSAVTTLSALHLSDNNLYGPFPSELLNLPFLRILDVANNRLSGRVTVPLASGTPTTLAFRGNFFSGVTLPTQGPPMSCSFLENNCFPSPIFPLGSTCQVGSQKSSLTCQMFCNATTPESMCGGSGFCLTDSNGRDLCQCLPGFREVRLGFSNSTCMPNSAGPFPRGYSWNSYLQQSSFNRWSRYLSRNRKIVNNMPRWDVPTVSNSFAPGDLFAPDTATPPFLWGDAQKQGSCLNCWAHSSSDAMTAAVSIAQDIQGSIRTLNVDTVAQCTQTNACSEGDPALAFDAAVQSGRRSKPPQCTTAFETTTVLMYENVQFNGWFGLLLSVGAQPVVVNLEASNTFQDWQPRRNMEIYEDLECYTGNIDHSVLLVGYQLGVSQSYWIIRNSWGAEWGLRGYMRMSMSQNRGTYPLPVGICGIYRFPGVYPIPAPVPGNPCYLNNDSQPSEMNPCGGGVCNPQGSYSYTCDCTKLGEDFTNADITANVSGILRDAGTVVMQACVPLDACGSQAFNPCRVGNCVNDEKGDYTCICPFGFDVTTAMDGGQTCKHSMKDSSAREVTIPLEKVECVHVALTYRVSVDNLISHNLNKGLNLTCQGPIRKGTTIFIPENTRACAAVYTISQKDKDCQNLRELFGLRAGALTALNPALDCENLRPGSVICVEDSPENEVMVPDCKREISVPPGQWSFSSLVETHGALPLVRNNPGLNRDFLELNSAQLGSTAPPVSVCIQADFGQDRGCRNCPRSENRNYTSVTKNKGVSCALFAVQHGWRGRGQLTALQVMTFTQTDTCRRPSWVCRTDNITNVCK